jgi:mono/diheme cytochrome c family protein
MSRRPLLVGILILVLVAAGAVAAVALHDPQPELSQALLQRKPDATRGAYIARLGDCTACHTAPGGKPFAGGLAFATPVGNVYSTNITSDKDTGIGHYTLKDFIRLMRFGVAPDRRNIYPAMPYTAFAKTSDEDLQDLFAYFMGQVAPVSQVNRTDIAWPFSMRWPLALWNVAFHDDSRYQPDTAQSAEWNRGAYLVQGFAHCGTCHTPRGVAVQERDVAGRTNLFLSGSSLDGSSPVNLRGNDADGLGKWNVEDIVTDLKTGRTALSAVHGPMTEVVANSTSGMTDDDLTAIAVYLKSLAPAPADGRATYTPNQDTFAMFKEGRANERGARIYLDSCAACHRTDGQGYDHAFPRLAGNLTVLAPHTDSLLAIIISGNRLPAVQDQPSRLAMPPYGWRWDDAEIADLATFLRSAWGNKAAPVVTSDVTEIRKQISRQQGSR